MIDKQKLFELIRISDTFFPIGSFALSQGMEQVVSENLLPKDKLARCIGVYLSKIWESFDLQIFEHALKAVKLGDIETLSKLDEICYASKITEENRTATVKMGHNLIKTLQFKTGSLGAAYADRTRNDETHGTYPIILAIASKEFEPTDMAGISLLYVNVIEVTASLVRMTILDHIESQQLLSETAKLIQLDMHELNDLNQSFPLIDIASMRHETNQNRMFMS